MNQHFTTVMSFALLSTAMMLTHCFPVQTPADQEQELAALAACVSANWGQPVLVIAHACTNDAVDVAENLIADIEAAIETAGSNAEAGAPAAFPYADDPILVEKVKQRKVHILYGKVHP